MPRWIRTRPCGVALEHAMAGLRAEAGLVALLSPTSSLLETTVSAGLPPPEAGRHFRLGESVADWVAREGRSLCVEDLTEDARELAPPPGFRAAVAVPLLVAGESRGVVEVLSKWPAAFTPADAELLEGIAAQAGRALQNAWLTEQARLKARLFESLASVSRAINTAVNLEEALPVITREARTLMDAKMAALLMLDGSREWLELRASSGAGEAYVGKSPVNVADSLLGGVVRRRKPLQEENVQTSPRYQHGEVARREGLVALLSVPLLFHDQALGALCVYKDRAYTFSNEEVRILTALAELSAIAIQKARLYERVVDVEELLKQKERLSALGWLAAEVAHEIRNPLTVLKLLYHSLDLRFGPDDPRARDAEIIEAKINDLNRIVERFLDFARTAEPAKEVVQLNDVVEELCLLVRHKLANQGVQLERDLATGLPSLWADASQLEQSFLNIVLNAAEAMPGGGTLRLRTFADGERVGIEFTDSGHGMSEPERALTSVLQSSKRSGTGIGLAIVRRVVEAHEGQIEIHSAPQQGTTVRIRLPARRSPSAE
jgi:signal transduction histidine kinase